MQERPWFLRGAVAGRWQHVLLPCALAGVTLTACSSNTGASAQPHGNGDAGDASMSVADAQNDAKSDATSPDSGASGDADLDSARPPLEAGGNDSSTHDAEIPDAPESTDAASVLSALSACLGTSQALTISGLMPYVDIPVGTESGEFLLDFATTFSSIDLSAFATPPTTTGCDATMLFQTCTVPQFAFFGAPGTVTLTTEDFSGITGSVRQAGIIGTDFLSEGVFTLAYGAKKAFDADGTSFCSDTLLGQAGMLPLTTAGFFENDLTKLEEYTQVDSNGAANTTVADVPTVPVKIAGVAALAQLDTGFDDSFTPFSVNINEAFLMAILAASPTALVRDMTLDETLTTCVNGVGEPILGYRLATGAQLAFVDKTGGAARSYPNAVIFVKNTPSAAATCGGIGVWTVPAAQVGASFYNDMGILAFDPYHETVWIPGN